MRFVRAYTRSDTGELVNVTEQETPFELAGLLLFADVPVSLEAHDLGLVEDFEPVSVSGARKCSPAAHLFERLERDPANGGFRAKAGHEIPPIIDCPATLEGIKQRVDERGPEAIPKRARAWLAFMLPPDKVEALGIADVTADDLIEMDAIRSRRDPTVGSRRAPIERLERDRLARVRHEREVREGEEAEKAREETTDGNAPLRQARPDDLRIDDRPGGLPGDEPR